MPGSGIDVFLKLDGIPGESAVKGHEKEIDVLSYVQSVEATIVLSGGGGASAGKATFPAVRFRKRVDAASVGLVLACASGQHIKDARFAFRQQAMDFDFYIVTLQDVLIGGVTQLAGTGEQYPLSFDALNAGASSSGFLENVTLFFGRLLWEHRARGTGGAVSTTASGGWDVRANTKV